MIALPVTIAVAVGGLWATGALGDHNPIASPTPSGSPTPAATGVVTVTARQLDPATATICRAVIAKLPEAISPTQQRRPVTSGAEQIAAYGEPPVTLTCGAPPPSPAPTDIVYPLGGVCWLPIARSNATEWTTLDRRITVTITVPGPGEGSGQSVVPFGPAVAAGDPAVANPPTGCLAR